MLCCVGASSFVVKLAKDLLASESSDGPANEPTDQVVTEARAEESAAVAPPTESIARTDTSVTEATSNEEAESAHKDDEEPS